MRSGSCLKTRKLKLTMGIVMSLIIFFAAGAAYALEEVNVAIISFSPYAPWYIVKEKNMAKGIDLNVKIIEGITEKNAAVSSGQIQVVMNTLDSMVLARAAGVPIKIVAVPAMSFGLDEMVVSKDIRSEHDFPGKSYGADYGFLNHMWMLLTLKRAGIDPKKLRHVVVLPQEGAAGFVSGGLDIDVNYIPFSKESLKRPGAHVLKTSFSDKTWERGLISESISFNEPWMKKHPAMAKELLRAWFEAVNWWKENPEEGNQIVAKGLDWKVEDVILTQKGAVMLSLDQNLGAFGIGDGKPVCMSIPDGAPEIPAEPSNWGKELFGGAADCVTGYVYGTYDLFNEVYLQAEVAQNTVSAKEGIDDTILKELYEEGYTKKYSSNQWIGRVGQ